MSPMIIDGKFVSSSKFHTRIYKRIMLVVNIENQCYSQNNKIGEKIMIIYISAEKLVDSI